MYLHNQVLEDSYVTGVIHEPEDSQMMEVDEDHDDKLISYTQHNEDENFSIDKARRSYICRKCPCSISYQKFRNYKLDKKNHLEAHQNQNSYRKFNIRCNFCNLFINDPRNVSHWKSKKLSILNTHKSMYHPELYELEIKQAEKKQQELKEQDKIYYANFMSKYYTQMELRKESLKVKKLKLDTDFLTSKYIYHSIYRNGYFCGICKHQCNDTSKIIDHICHHFSYKRLKCDKKDCNFETSNQSHMKKHLRENETHEPKTITRDDFPDDTGLPVVSEEEGDANKNDQTLDMIDDSMSVMSINGSDEDLRKKERPVRAVRQQKLTKFFKKEEK